MGLDAATLLDGPQGRILCWLVADELGFERHGRYRLRVPSFENSAAALAALEGVLAEVDLGVLGASDALTLCGHLAQAVDRAAYWQPPDEIAPMLATEQVRAALAPVAGALADAPGARWWGSGLVGDQQVLIEWMHPGAPGRPRAASGALSLWRARALESEARCRGRNTAAEWWSAPITWAGDGNDARRAVVSTTRSLPGLGAVGLLLDEDSVGWTTARCWPVRAATPVRVAEIYGPGDWLALAEAAPLELTWSRRGTWGECTGEERRWVVPDWQALAEVYDAVHVSVAGYLAAAGRALERADGSATVLAGWNPDETYWLADVLVPAGSPSEWEAPAGEAVPSWQRVAPATA